jgi:membrane-bound lytic murein transglycosylase D
MINILRKGIFITTIISLWSTCIVFSNTSTNILQPPSLIIDKDIPLPLNQDVLDMIVFFQTERVKPIEKALSLMDRYLPRMQEIFREEGVPEVLAYLPFIESAYDPLAKSRVGARGIWQFMPAAAKTYGLRVDYWIDERVDPEKSCRAAAKYLKYYYQKFGDWTLAIASYNAGPSRISKASKKLSTKDFWEIKKSKYIRHQTKSYIPAFIAGVYIAKNPSAFGFKHVPIPAESFEIVIIPDMTELSVIARCAGTDLPALQRLNPELKRQMTPRGYKDYQVRIPEGLLAVFTSEFSKIKPEERIRNLYYAVKRGDTLSSIAKRYRVSLEELRSINNIRSSRSIKTGSVLIIPVIHSSSVQHMIAEAEGTGSDNASASIRMQTRYSRGERIDYNVKYGDSLSLIAKRFKTNIESICAWNNFDSNQIIKKGTRLTVYYLTKVEKGVSADTAMKSANGSFLTHVVRQGDTLYDIAKSYNVSIANIKSINRIRGSRLYPGDRLLIPVAND